MFENYSDGGKFRGNSCLTFDEIMKVVIATAKACGKVNMIVAKKNKGMAGGAPKVKFTDIPGGLLLKIRQPVCVQEVRILCRDVPRTRLQIARALRDRNIPICFKN